MTKNFQSVLGRVENIVGKGENAGYQHFLLFPQCFQKAPFTCFCTLRHYVILNRNFNENHVQYVHSKLHDPPLSHCTQFESFLIVSTKTGKQSLKINVKRHSTSAWNDILAM